MESAVLERVKTIIQAKGLNVSQFAASINMSQTTVNNYVTGKRGISFGLINSILVNMPDISAEWLIKGEGDMYKTNTKVFVSDRRLDESVVPLYDLDVSAGLSKLFVSGGDLLGNISIPNMPRADGALHVTGDSMYPLIKAGDIIAYKVVHDVESINFGEIYIIQLEHEGDVSVVVKYIKRSEDDGMVKLVSYNKEHDPKDVPVTWIKALARVTFSVRKYSLV